MASTGKFGLDSQDDLPRSIPARVLLFATVVNATRRFSWRNLALVATAVAFATAGALTAALHAVEADPENNESLIRRVMAQTTRSGVGIRSTRELRAGTLSGNHKGWMTVETALTPAGAFSWKVIDEGGSSRTRNKVFRALMETEAESWRGGERDAAALTLDNYEFTPLPASRAGEIQIRVHPKRAEPKLIDGVLTVSAEGYPLRLEGKLAKSPSFWVKSVTVHKRYGRFAGVALPTRVESTADLRIFGKSTFTMHYTYREVNGQVFSATSATADLRH